MMSVIIVALGYIGTTAMLLVAGGIFTHNIHLLHSFFESNLTFSGIAFLITIASEIGVSLIVGLIAFMLFRVFKTISKKN